MVLELSAWSGGVAGTELTGTDRSNAKGPIQVVWPLAPYLASSAWAVTETGRRLDYGPTRRPRNRDGPVRRAMLARNRLRGDEMTEEARLIETEHGLVPDGEGWFIVNAGAARWRHNEQFGSYCSFEGEARFPHVGVNIHVLEPGQPACMYHREDQQEDFLVLSGRCLLLVDEQERELRQWDFFHAAPGTNHVFVGAGDGACAILMLGRRDPDTKIVYPRSELAAKHQCSVETETPNPREAYAAVEPSETGTAPPMFR